MSDEKIAKLKKLIDDKEAKVLKLDDEVLDLELDDLESETGPTCPECGRRN